MALSLASMPRFRVEALAEQTEGRAKAAGEVRPPFTVLLVAYAHIEGDVQPLGLCSRQPICGFRDASPLGPTK